jgi:hypothetical protein
VNRLARFVVIACLAAAALPAAAAPAAARMYVGFQDDAAFRFRADRHANLDDAVRAHATIVRSTIDWAKVAPTQPADPSNPFDPAYRLDDIDEFVREAQLRGLSPMLQIWGTPEWANGGAGKNHAPTNVNDLKDFAQAVAARYSGRYAGFPFVGFWSVWNEPNLSQFLSPQFTGSADTGPALYARLFAAAYSGIKSGNSHALVGLGDTSARGRDKHVAGVQDTHSPGRFFQLVARANSHLRFDAIAHHPYPTDPHQTPDQNVRWPNVSLKLMPQLEKSVNTWFHRRSTPMWITEYGHETVPDSHGVSYGTQATYARRALQIARGYPYVNMFIWFVLHDDQGDPWQSGLIAENGTKKPAFAAFSAVARLVNAYSPIVNVRARRRNPTVRVPALELVARSGVGAVVGTTARVYYKNKLVAVSQPQTKLGIDGWFTIPIRFTPLAKHTYSVRLQINDINGNRLNRTLTLVAGK